MCKINYFYLFNCEQPFSAAAKQLVFRRILCQMKRGIKITNTSYFCVHDSSTFMNESNDSSTSQLSWKHPTSLDIPVHCLLFALSSPSSCYPPHLPCFFVLHLENGDYAIYDRCDLHQTMFIARSNHLYQMIPWLVQHYGNWQNLSIRKHAS